MQLSILSGNRNVPAFGMDGGAPGRLGANRVRRADGDIEILKGCDSTDMKVGDIFEIETPTGGGFGKSE